jgi:hypothetical protein
MLIKIGQSARWKMDIPEGLFVLQPADVPRFPFRSMPAFHQQPGELNRLPAFGSGG